MNLPMTSGLDRPVVYFGFEALPVTSSPAVGFTAATMITATKTALVAKVVCETAPVRYRCDGVAPTTTVGTLLNPGDVLYVTGGNLATFKAIAVSATATLDCEYGQSN